ncbi:MAG TPA: DUF1552 domain-containing protein, partial [Gemmatimonadaceae bacterium]|nr:DUF1552 domain-containing protein [Gemmatimonadaceae bacterium]
MHFLTDKPLPRRTFVRGMGATFALPFLDAMMPAGRGLWRTGAAGTDRTRLVAIEMVHGAAGCNDIGAKLNLWAPAGLGKQFDLSALGLKSLEPFKDYMTIVSNTDVRQAEPVAAKEIGGDHFRSSAVYLTQSHPKQTEGSDIYVGTSLDQIYAQKFGQETPIPSMQLCIENVDQAGGCAYGYACVYTDSISWSSPTEPLPVIRDPRVAFEKLFGVGGSFEERAARRRSRRSILDFVASEMASLEKTLGAADRGRMERYLDDIREVERRIQRVEARNETGEQRELAGAPAGVPDSFEEHVKLMFDIQALAFAADITRVFSFKMGRDGSSRVYPESGSDKPFHPASHHGGNEKGVKEFQLINKYHVALLPYFLDKLKSMQEGDKNLLDKTLIMYGSPMGDSNLHNHRRVPLMLLGGANGKLQGNAHIKAPDGTPMANA